MYADGGKTKYLQRVQPMNRGIAKQRGGLMYIPTRLFGVIVVTAYLIFHNVHYNDIRILFINTTPVFGW